MSRAVIRRFQAMARGGENPADRLRIGAGAIADYDGLAALHYKAGRPATWARVLRAADPEEETVGVLVVSRPTLNGAWRAAAWPDLAGGGRREAAARLNAQLRTISRVVVDPRWRGLGVGARLVRAYLREPLTPRTEAVAAMGSFCRMFEAAGMRAVPIPPTRPDAVLRETLQALGVEAADLPGAVQTAPPALLRALRGWAWRHRSQRRPAQTCDYASMARGAAGRLCTVRMAYVAGPERPFSRGGP